MVSPSLRNFLIRPEEPGDYSAIHAVNASAFETSAEANLVELLRREVDPIVSLVAEKDNEIVGHIMFSPVFLSGHANLKLMGLGPMAVVPEQQRKGIGSALMKEGLKRCKELGYGAAVVLGHKDFYPRFGFIPSVCYGIWCEFNVPSEVFMIVELLPGYLHRVQGIIKYNAAFNDI